ncbi:hypothetical protein Ga0100231_016375 [Opitutaceae bacterium TAV4]|nr:hypothetical protein Ga0100231_016375 [Opitutaceae bacterium TAV4]RRK02197.1 hypothetical protein Ga0100230_003130 [Opitutaceae bacterium TAV3]
MNNNSLKSVRFLRVGLAGFLLAASPVISTQLAAAIIASDSFSYDASSPLNDASGGSGWTSNWTADAVATTSASGSGVTFGNGSDTAPNKDELAYRTFATQSGDALFVSMTLTATGHEGNDFFALWLDNTVGSGNHGPSRLNVGMASGKLIARLSNIAGLTSTGPAVVNNTSYQLVVAYTKSVPGSDKAFDTLKWWINPTTAADFATPFGTVSSSGLTSISSIGFRGASNEPADQYFVNNLVIATTWDDVVSVIPEPHTASLVTGIATLVLLATVRLTRRNR